MTVEEEIMYYLRRLPADEREAYMEHLRQVAAEHQKEATV